MRAANTSMPTRLTCSLNSSAEAVRILSSSVQSAPISHPSLHAVQAQEQVRRGPTSVSEFEVSLADIYKGASIDVRPFLLFFIPATSIPTKNENI
jgi:hypothetical protein